LLVELALVERKFAVFGGGFGVSQQVDRVGELTLFIAGLLLAQAILIAFLYLLIRGLHGRAPPPRLFLFNFLFFTLAGGCALLAAKYQLLSYFSDAFGLSMMRDLGGGSLLEAVGYVRDELWLLMTAVGAAIIGYVVGLALFRRLLPPLSPLPGLRWRHLLWLLLLFAPVAFIADRNPDARYALSRFNAYAIADKALSEASDFDRDGYSLFGARPDTHPLDAKRHPLALDIPNNGIDEDGIGGDFRFNGPDPAPSVPILPQKKRHLVLIVLESTRADAIGRRVQGVEVTPHLNALARSGTYVHDAYSHVGFTSPSLKSLFSGRLAPIAGQPSLFTDLKANGYQIGVFSGQSERFGDISAVTGMEKAASIFVDAEALKAERSSDYSSESSIRIDGRLLLREYDRRLGNSAWKQPTFLYFNFQEPHFPYNHKGMQQILPGSPIARGDISPANRDQVARTYWNAVAVTDRLVGQLIARLKRAGVWDDTLLVVTADHGESLFDDDFLGHGHVINRQQTQVPLIISDPAVRLQPPVGLSDYRGIILRALGAPQPQRTGPVFQYIGSLDAPAEIGLAEGEGRFTTLRLGTEIVSFSDTGRQARLADLPPGSPDQARALRLVNAWARERWLAHLQSR
jgi:phosphoglycerol transferase MdoB-like AlkP superfamily enzyme